jgi:hypothetical protein
LRVVCVDPDYDLVIETYSALWPRFAQFGFSGLTEPERVLLCTWQFVCEVNNGGFHQFFTNPSGAFAAETVAALEQARMPHAASLLRRALTAFPAPAKEQEARCWQLCGLPDSIQRDLFDKLTAAFSDSAEDPYALQADYVRRNRGQFLASRP